MVTLKDIRDTAAGAKLDAGFSGNKLYDEAARKAGISRGMLAFILGNGTGDTGWLDLDLTGAGAPLDDPGRGMVVIGSARKKAADEKPKKPQPPPVVGTYIHQHIGMPDRVIMDHSSMPDKVTHKHDMPSHVTHEGHLTIDPVTGHLAVGPVTGNVNLVAPATLPHVQMDAPDRFPVVGMNGEVTLKDIGGHREANYKELYARTYLDGLRMRTERGDTPDQLDKYHADFLNGMLRFAEHFEGEKELKPLTREVAGAEYDRIRDNYRRSTDYNINTRGMSRDAAENAARAEIIGKMVLGEYGSGLKGGYDPKI